MGMTSLGPVARRNLASGDIGRLFASMTVCFDLGQVIGPGLASLLAYAMGDFSLAMGVAGFALAASGFLALGLPNGDALSD